MKMSFDDDFLLILFIMFFLLMLPNRTNESLSMENTDFIYRRCGRDKVRKLSYGG